MLHHVMDTPFYKENIKQNTYNIEFIVDAVLVGFFERVQRRVVVDGGLERGVVVVGEQVHPV